MNNPESKKPQTSHRLSAPAAADLFEAKDYLDIAPSWVNTVSSSVVIEFLVWYFFKVLHENKTDVKVKDFRPKTKAGRPQSIFETGDGFRPAHFRQKDSVADIWNHGKV